MTEPAQPSPSPQALNAIKFPLQASLVCAVVLFFSEEGHWLSRGWRGAIFAVMIGQLCGALAPLTPLTRTPIKLGLLFGAVVSGVSACMLVYAFWNSVQAGGGSWTDWSAPGGFALAAVLLFVARAMFNGFRDEQKFGHLYWRN